MDTKQTISESQLLKDITIRDSLPLYTISELKATLTPILSKYDVKKAILFGSYAHGNADHRSDIDLVVDTDLKGLSFYGLLGEVSDSLRFPVDLIAKRQIERGSDFEKEITENGLVIYEKPHDCKT